MPTIGSSLGPYRVLDLLGEGGMGAVYLAEDTRLGRRVALKLLAPHARGDDEARRRLLREARTVAGLRHPSLCGVHDVIEAEGLDVLVLEYLEGRTLRERLAGGPLPVGEACTLAIQIAEGLAAAHDAGVIHRDLKPGNVMVGTGGRAVVMDFGLARGAGDSRLTRTGTVMGTVAYMAPEQIRGEAADQRTDIWAFGAVLYEMLAGRQPFAAEHEQAVIYGILNRSPRPLGEVGPEVPAALAQVAARALARDPGKRHQSARELLDDLRAARQAMLADAERPTRPLAARRARRLPRRGGMLAAAGLLAVAAAAFLLLRHGPAPPSIDSVAVLPFANLSGDPSHEYIADGVTEALITELSRIEKLRVISRTSVMQYKEARAPLPEIARALGVQAVVEGSALRVGDRLRITAQLIEARSDRHLWAQDYDRDYGDLLALQKDVARQIAKQVRIELAPGEQARLDGAGAEAAFAPEVVDAWLRGTQILSGMQWSRLEEGLRHFEAALALDPDCAPAQAGAAACHLLLTMRGPTPPAEGLPRAREAALRALALDPDEALAHMVMGYVAMAWEWDWELSRTEFERALEIAPAEPAARHGYADYLLLMGRPEESLQQVRTTRLHDPASAVVQTIYVAHLLLAGRPAEALQEIAANRRADPQYQGAVWEAQALWLLGRREEALEIHRGRFRNDPEALAALDRGLAAGGPQAALRALGILVAARQRNRLRQMDPTEFFAAAGLADSTLAWLETAARNRDVNLFHRLTSPLTVPFAGDPRYRALLRRMKLPEDAIERLTSRRPAAG